ncbi:hypothetical protein AVEN_191728-1 [Araneus ventricosus]|uniref:HTH psq-type domain-containing protein n=1 Tax=Araneus ventricosus TaxID=182803 RepID=A0A4Y2IR60_ARAVE|nr:hypothetical protein AVEN_191728-1 [Araneus ventricosus]
MMNELPSRSQDPIPLEFFLWLLLKELIYRNPGTFESDSVTLLHAAFTNVDTTVLDCVQLATVRRVHACLKMYSGHFEQLLIATVQTDSDRVKMASKRKRLNLKEKIDVLEVAEKEKLSVRSLAERSHVGITQISELLKDKEGIRKM